MTILFLDQFSDLGGAQRCLLDLMPALRERGWRAVVAAPGDGPLLQLSAEQGAVAEPVRQAAYGLGRKPVADFLRFAVEMPRLAADIRRLIERHRAGLLYVNGPRMLPAASWANRGRVPAVFHAHSYLKQRYAAVLAGRAVRNCQATVIAACRFVTGPLRPFVDPSRMHVVYNGVPDCGFRERRREGGFRIGVVGRIAPQKGQRCFVEAARVLAATHPQCRFVVAGSPLFKNREAESYFEVLRREAAGLPLEFTGWSGDVPAVLAGLDLLVAPSTGPEATPRVIPEAWSAGVPVLASRLGGIAELVADGKTGFLVEPGSPRALAERMAEVLSLPEWRLQQVTRAARSAYQERFTLERYRQGIAELIGPLLRQQPP
jgi:glycosyltransferase involved in cell wall biosynthesis